MNREALIQSAAFNPVILPEGLASLSATWTRRNPTRPGRETLLWLENLAPSARGLVEELAGDLGLNHLWESEDRGFLIGPPESLMRLGSELDPRGERELALALSSLAWTMPARQFWQVRGRGIELGPCPLFMGILNVTPDSFFDGGHFLDPVAALARARALETEGADLVDIGGESSRPGAGGITADEERRRLMPLLEPIVTTMATPVSVDTTKSRVAADALAAGAHIINDVSTLRNDRELADVVAAAEAGLVLMHSRGTPQDMQRRTDYADPVIDVLREWRQGLRVALEAGVAPQSVCLDPGIGFAKSLETNLLLLRALPVLAHTGFPVLVGHSRKAFIGHLLEGREPPERLHGTIGASLAIALGGARILRVHDVKANRDALHVALAVLGARQGR